MTKRQFPGWDEPPRAAEQPPSPAGRSRTKNLLIGSLVAFLLGASASSQRTGGSLAVILTDLGLLGLVTAGVITLVKGVRRLLHR